MKGRGRNEDRNREREGEGSKGTDRQKERKRQIEIVKESERETEGGKGTSRTLNILSNGKWEIQNYKVLNFLQFPHTFILKTITGKNKKNLLCEKEKLLSSLSPPDL